MRAALPLVLLLSACAPVTGTTGPCEAMQCDYSCLRAGGTSGVCRDEHCVCTGVDAGAEAAVDAVTMDAPADAQPARDVAGEVATDVTADTALDCRSPSDTCEDRPGYFFCPRTFYRCNAAGDPFPIIGGESCAARVTVLLFFDLLSREPGDTGVREVRDRVLLDYGNRIRTLVIATKTLPEAEYSRVMPGPYLCQQRALSLNLPGTALYDPDRTTRLIWQRAGVPVAFGASPGVVVLDRVGGVELVEGPSVRVENVRAGIDRLLR